MGTRPMGFAINSACSIGITHQTAWQPLQSLFLIVARARGKSKEKHLQTRISFSIIKANRLHLGGLLYGKKSNLAKAGFLVPPIALGCMRLAGAERTQADAFLHTALELELNFFRPRRYLRRRCMRACVRRDDKATRAFAAKILSFSRNAPLCPAKCTIFSKEHILSAVNGSLKRLGTDYLDVFASAPSGRFNGAGRSSGKPLTNSKKSGKVRHFGVSNEDPYTMELLQSALHQPICANQLQMSLTNATMIAQPMNTNICDGLNPGAR